MRILVTGASRGIGRELCLFFSQLGHEVLAVARSEEPLRRLAEENLNIEAWPMDINQWQELADRLGERYSHLDLLVHNAAAFINKPFREVALEDMQQVYHTNVYVPYFLTQALLPLLKEGSQVLAISSVGGQGGSMKFPGLSVYSSSKGALNILVECLATELGEEGIIVNGLALGSSATEMFKAAFPDMEAASSPEEMAKFIGNFAIQSPGLVQGKVYSVSSSNP
ncbi:MAG: SDR family oxidoreductase [Bacteroidetes bacterium]|nr:SDR family oxidoreductase [Bacteroidota bacterium]